MNKLRVKLDETMIMRTSIKFMIFDFVLAGVSLICIGMALCFAMIYGSEYLIEAALAIATSIYLFVSSLSKGCEEIRFLKGGCKVED